MEQSQTITELAKALALAQGQLRATPKKSENPYFKRKYADLATLWETCRKPLTDNALAIIQTTDIVGEGENQRIVLETTLTHSSGEWVRGKLALKPVKDDPQGIGSVLTYARRYALSAIVGLTSEDEDDDAEGAMGRQETETVTVAQLSKIFASSKEKGFKTEEVQAYMATRFSKAHTRELNKGEASLLISAIEEGKIR